MELNGTLYVGMENLLNGSGALCFKISVTTLSPAWNVSLTCNTLNESPNTPVISTTTTIVSRSQTADIISTGEMTVDTISTGEMTVDTISIGEITKTVSTISTNTSSPSKTSTVSQTMDIVSTGDITNTMFSSTIDQTNRVTEAKINDDKLPIILGCSVGGTVLIILLIVIVGCVLFRRQKTKISSGNSHHGEMVEIKNNINVSSDSISNNNNQHGTKYMAEMEIIPNDLYQSSDSLFGDPNELGQHEHVPEQHEHGTKDKPVMEIIPNDLYQSADSLADDLNRLGHNPEQHAPGLGQREHIPYTNPEYALVNKKPKKVPNRMKINQNPNKVQADYENIEKEKKTIKLEIDRIVGPKGDDYTLVNKC